jgi:signal transduction histidine kinase
MKLAVALTFSALFPVCVAIGVPMLQAEKRAQENAARRLMAARRQAAVLVERRKADTVSRLMQVAKELAAGRSIRQALLQGPAAAAGPTVRALAERHGLDYLEVRNAQGAVLATSREEIEATPAVSYADVDEGNVVLRPLPERAGGSASMAFFSRQAVILGRDVLSLVGGSEVGAGFVAGVSEILGEPAVLLDASGEAAEAAGKTVRGVSRIAHDVPIGESGWALRVSVPAGDAAAVRREFLGTFAGVAPFAVLSALLVALALAAGIARPIRALAARAEALVAERAGGPLSPAQAEDEVRRLTIAFDEMLEALTQSERQRGAAEQIAAWQGVARRIAHEVKNPLSPITIAVQNLKRTREKAPHDFDRAFQEETATILEEVQTLRRLVDEFSLFARLPRPEPAPCDLRKVVAQALQLFAPRIEALGVRVTLDVTGAPETVRADPEQIGRALKNVVANALDAMEPVAERRLSIAVRRVPVTRGALPEDLTEIEIGDSGVGFEPDALRHVFEPYFTTRADRGGTGLGMAIVYRTVIEHGGTIRASGAPGRGAIITLRLPVGGPLPGPA